MTTEQRAGSTDPIPISLVSHFEFCPRRAWLEAAGERVEVEQMEIGTREHRRADDTAASRATDVRAVEVSDDALGVTGRVDAVVSRDGAYRVREYKATPVRRSPEVTPPMRTQLALQAECLRAAGLTVEGTEIYFTSHNRVVEVDLRATDLARMRAAVEATRACVSACHAPEPLEDDPRCSRCSHVGVCLPDERSLEPVARTGDRCGP